MRTSNNILNSVEVAFTDNFASVPTLVGKTAADAIIVEGDGVGLLDDNVGVIGSTNEMVDEVMFNMVSDSFHKSYNYVNKIIM